MDDLIKTNERLFNRIYSSYDNRLSRSLFINPILKIVETIKVDKDKSILDVGIASEVCEAI